MDIRPKKERTMPQIFTNLSAMGMQNQNTEWAQNWFGDAVVPNNMDQTLINMPAVDTKNSSVVRLPFIGKFHFVSSVQGVIQISCIFLYWIYGMWSIVYVILLPQYHDGRIKVHLLYFYIVIGILTLASLVRVSTLDPGRVYDYMEEMAADNLNEWTFCSVCRFMRPPRAHHCRQCKHCVLRMDHHCPWINNCVGEANHWAFFQLVTYALIMSLTGFILTLLQLFYFPPCVTCNMDLISVYYSRNLTLISLVVSGLMLCGTIGLVTIHHIGFLTDMTTIDWMKLQKEITEKGYGPHLKLPTSKYSCLKAYSLSCGRGHMLTWLFPCRRQLGPYGFANLLRENTVHQV